ncbi:MAG: serine hydrolase domain-containing protein [Pseudomonadota bacterium]
MTLGLAGIVLASAAPASAQSIDDYQAIIDTYLAERGEAEGITGVSVYISLGDPGPGIELFAGTTGRDGATPITGDTLFQIGSNTKAFTAALILDLEAEGSLNIDQTIGDWLPDYPAWGDVTIRRLLNMTSGIPNYSESPEWMRMAAEDPDRHFTPEELIALAYPGATVELPPNDGYFYSNTNYLLAGLIAEQAGGMPYGDALRQRFFAPTQLGDTFYQPLAYPSEVTERMARGYFEDPACSFYVPDCEETELADLMGQDISRADVSWAGPAGGIVSSPRDLARWVRAVFDGRVLPPAQLEELLSPVSVETGEPIEDVSADDPAGFSLGFARRFREGLGAFWFYQGETLGYRAVFIYSPETDVVVTGATNSHPFAEDNQFVPMMARLYALATQ